MKHTLLTLIACALGLLTACDKPASTSTPQTPESKAKGTIGVSLITLDNPFFKVIEKSTVTRRSSSVAIRTRLFRAIR